MLNLRAFTAPILATVSVFVLAAGNATAMTLREAVDDVLGNSGRKIVAYAKENYCPSKSPGYYKCNLDDGFTISFEDVGGKAMSLTSSREFSGDEEAVLAFNTQKRILTKEHKPQEVTKNQSSSSTSSESRGSDDYKCSHQIGPWNQIEFKTISKSKEFQISIVQGGRIETVCTSYGRIKDIDKRNPIIDVNVYDKF